MSTWSIQFQTVKDERGRMGVADFERDIPFEVKRVYYLTNLRGSHPRGFHAHKELRQLATCLTGSCKLLLDTSDTKEWVELKAEDNGGVLIEPMVWHELHDFSQDCVFLVYASDVYKESDYIRSYPEFLTIARKSI
jgi:dTDP-4-dehydrorhamnose 3,5-epimerase-like enzyme